MSVLLLPLSLRQQAVLLPALLYLTTVTFCVAVPVLPAASVAVHVTIVVPTGNVTGASLLNEGTPSTRSVAVAVPMDTVVSAPAFASTFTSAGGVT